MSRYWYDSFPGIEVETGHPILDPYGTPYGGAEEGWEWPNRPLGWAWDDMEDHYAPYTTVSQNRGGVA